MGTLGGGGSPSSPEEMPAPPETPRRTAATQFAEDLAREGGSGQVEVEGNEEVGLRRSRRLRRDQNENASAEEVRIVVENEPEEV